jgi:hypothetical protein
MYYPMPWTQSDAAQQNRQAIIPLKYSDAYAFAASVAYLAQLTLQLREQKV